MDKFNWFMTKVGEAFVIRLKQKIYQVCARPSMKGNERSMSCIQMTGDDMPVRTQEN